MMLYDYLWSRIGQGFIGATLLRNNDILIKSSSPFVWAGRASTAPNWWMDDYHMQFTEAELRKLLPDDVVIGALKPEDFSDEAGEVKEEIQHEQPGVRENGFMKYDTDKVNLYFVEGCIDRAIARIGMYGAFKYKPDNWQLAFQTKTGEHTYESVMEGIKVYNAAKQRHDLASRQDPLAIDDVDELGKPGSGMLHIWHSAWCCMAITYGYELLKKLK